MDPNQKIKTAKTYKLVFLIIIGALITFTLLYTLHPGKFKITQCSYVNRAAKIQPDYSGTFIPPNIAPLNFLIMETGSRYFVRIYSQKGNPIEIFSNTGKIAIPYQAWHKLLNTNRANQLYFDIYVKNPPDKSSLESNHNQWLHFQTVVNTISSDNIDDFLVYRKIRPTHRIWRDMGIYQRNLNSFDESLILHNGYFKHGCLNCHTFCNNRTDKMLLGIRSAGYGSSALLVEDDKVKKINAKFGYTSWHPSGKIAAFSVNEVRQLFHSSAPKVRDVMDFDSLIAYYLVNSKTIKTSPKLADKNRLETYPAWSPDGRYLYFCSAPITWQDRTVVPQSYNQIKYDLVKISYDLESDRWGELETVLSANDTDLSILLPRISPDGRWLLFCMCNYGYFPVYQRSSDLYMTDLREAEQTGQYNYRRLDINSNDSESWHSWSSNSQWIAFSSKRQSGVFTRIYLAYVDEKGEVHKPILLPQKDPAYYDSCLWTFSVPELVIEPVRVRKEKIGRVVRSSQKISADMPITMATPKAGAPPGHDEPWQSGHE